MVPRLLFICIGLLFLSGFFFLDQGNADPYREKNERVDNHTIAEIKRHHQAALFTAEEGDQDWLDVHFQLSIETEDIALFLSIPVDVEPVLLMEEENTVMLRWSTVLVQYEQVHNVWKITSVMEERSND